MEMKTGEKVTDEQKQKISDAQKGKPRKYKLNIEGLKKGQGRNKGIPMKEEVKQKISESKKGQTSRNKGIKYTEEQKKKLKSQFIKGCIPRNKGKKTGPNPEQSKRMKGRIPYNKGKKNISWIGKNNPRRKGGITPKLRKIRDSLEVRLRRRDCFERDNFTCQCCGVSGGYLHAHHIHNFSEYKELRTSINNGITLCKECHIKFHNKYTRKNNTKEQLKEFLTSNY